MLDKIAARRDKKHFPQPEAEAYCYDCGDKRKVDRKPYDIAYRPAYRYPAGQKIRECDTRRHGDYKTQPEQSTAGKRTHSATAIISISNINIFSVRKLKSVISAPVIIGKRL